METAGLGSGFIGELPEGFARTALDCGLARSLLRCEGREQALALLRRDGDAVFVLPTTWGGEKILDLARSLGPTWRRGLLVGAPGQSPGDPGAQLRRLCLLPDPSAAPGRPGGRGGMSRLLVLPALVCVNGPYFNREKR